MKKFLIILLALSVLTFAVVAQSAVKDKMEGSVVATKIGASTIHTYVSPEKSGAVTSHVIEGPKKLVIIDAQFLRPYAKELRAYADSLGKPIDRVIITHGHPDHWYGLEFFKDMRVTSLPEVAGLIKQAGPAMIKGQKARLKDLITDAPVVPDGKMKEGKETIDGIAYVFERVKDAEADSQLLITLPDYGTLVAQDLAYNKIHLFLGADDIKGWEKVVTELKKRPGIKTVLCGHGKPAGPIVFDDMLKYLDVADKSVTLAKKGSHDVKPLLLKEFPDYKAPVLLDISNRMLFKKGK